MIFPPTRSSGNLFVSLHEKVAGMARAKFAPSFRLWAVCVSTIVLATVCVRQLSMADEIDQDTAELVAAMVPQFHLNGGELNDEVGVKTLDGFIDRLDGSKLYF